MELFYSDNIVGDTIILNAAESRHCYKVLRKNIGDSVNVVDGSGILYNGEIILIDKDTCKIHIKKIQKNFNKKNYYIHIAISPIKNHERLEFFIEKSIEIGVDEISFIKCQRTLRNNIKLNRIRNIAISAMKQTLKAKLPKINGIESFSSFIENCNSGSKFICHLENDNRKNLFTFKESILELKNSCVLIGPEGDFTNEEILVSEKIGFNAISLGESRLRTETAGIVSCNIINLINEF